MLLLLGCVITIFGLQFIFAPESAWSQTDAERDGLNIQVVEFPKPDLGGPADPKSIGTEKHPNPWLAIDVDGKIYLWGDIWEVMQDKFDEKKKAFDRFTDPVVGAALFNRTRANEMSREMLRLRLDGHRAKSFVIEELEKGEIKSVEKTLSLKRSTLPEELKKALKEIDTEQTEKNDDAGSEREDLNKTVLSLHSRLATLRAGLDKDPDPPYELLQERADVAQELLGIIASSPRAIIEQETEASEMKEPSVDAESGDALNDDTSSQATPQDSAAGPDDDADLIQLTSWRDVLVGRLLKLESEFEQNRDSAYVKAQIQNLETQIADLEEQIWAQVDWDVEKNASAQRKPNHDESKDRSAESDPETDSDRPVGWGFRISEMDPIKSSQSLSSEIHSRIGQILKAADLLEQAGEGEQAEALREKARVLEEELKRSATPKPVEEQLLDEMRELHEQIRDLRDDVREIKALIRDEAILGVEEDTDNQS
ncbi:MAG: hypothetical protein CMJ46_12985 [Planctomyces sp.]|nr:hypothetical protein [Planctomyces sp.]